MVLLSPGENWTPAELLRSAGAPFWALNAPPLPMTRSCVPLLLNVTAWPALMVTSAFPVKFIAPMVMVAAPVVPPPEGTEVAVGAGVSVGIGVSVGAPAALVPPQAASSSTAARVASAARRWGRRAIRFMGQ